MYGAEEKLVPTIITTDFDVHCKYDLAKRSILFPKAVLESLCVWPDGRRNLIKRYYVVICLISLLLMELAHVIFMLMNVKNISIMASTCTTVSTTIETMIKLITMLYFHRPLNEILRVIWKDFWPANMASAKRQQAIRTRSLYVTVVGSTFLFMAYVSSGQFMAYPLIANTGQLPLSSWFPFDYRPSPLYEFLYLWHWFMNAIIISTLGGFDAFFNSIVMMCACQFQILHEVLETMCENPRVMKWGHLFADRDLNQITEYDVLIKCVQHHLKLIRVVELIEQAFTHIVFFQFVFSTMAICVSFLALVADPTLLEHMLSYCVAHLLQFFIYCSVGNELTYQSVMVADASYSCPWEFSNNRGFKKGLIMILQRSQKPVTLTVAGLMQLSFENFVSTVQLSFSFYTLLNSFV